MDQIKVFIAEEKELEFFNAKALINIQFEVLYIDDNGDEAAYSFPGYVSAYFRVYDEREGQLLKNFAAQIVRSSNILNFNCSVDDMTFENLGKYHFEMGFNSSGYEIPIRFSQLNIK